MKSIFDRETREEVIRRIDSLNPASRSQWGKMTVEQMVRHCVKCDEYYFGGIPVKRSFIGRLLGKVAINSILKNEASGMRRNSPTALEFKTTEDVQDLEAEKAKWSSLIEKYTTYPHDYFMHWFFGKLTKQQLGQLVYKHCDHHLRQFSC